MASMTGTIAQCRFLNKLISTKDTSLLTINNIDESFFCDYEDLFKFIKSHIDTYDSVPDIETVLERFPYFDVIEVNEPNEFVVDSLYQDKNMRFIRDSFNDVKHLVEARDINKATEYISLISDKMSSAKHLDALDIIHNTDRFSQYLDRCSDFSSYFVTTGLKEIDSILGGWDRKEEDAVIVAKSNVGKSWILLKMATEAARRGLKVGIYSGEMSHEKVAYRVDTFVSHVSNRALTHGDINIQDEYKAYINNIKKEVKGDIFVLTPNDVGGSVGVNVLKGFIEKYKLDILYIDQYSLLDDDRHAKDPVTKLSNIANDIKLLQVRKQIPIITVCQQNRTNLEAEGVYTLDRISGSDRIGQNATTVLFLDVKDGVLTINIAKSRDTARNGKIRYAWDIDKGIFNYLPEEDDASPTSSSECDDLGNEYDYDIDSGSDNTFN